MTGESRLAEVARDAQTIAETALNPPQSKFPREPTG